MSRPENTREWVARMVAVLEQRAREERCITYAELAEEAQVPGPHRIHKLTLALEDLITADSEQGAPLRAAAAISKARDGLPGPGFFAHCRKIGRYFGPESGPQAETFHRIELDRLFVSFRQQDV